MTSAHQSRPTTGTAASGNLPPLFPTLPVNLGDYTLTQLLGTHCGHDTYLARQRHVGRSVVLELRRPSAGDEAAAAARFLANARARVGARLPHVAAVLESATLPEGFSYISQPLPEGRALSTMEAEGLQLTPAQVCALICAAAEVYAACAEGGLAAAPFTADRVFMSKAGSFSFLSPVLEGTPAEGDTMRQQQGLAGLIRPLQPLNVPGQGRIATLMTWMQEGFEGEPLDWAGAAATAELIAEQLKPEPILQLNRPQRYDRGREQRAGKRRRRMQRTRGLLLGLAAATILAMGIGGFCLAPESVPPIPAWRGGYVHLREGDKTFRVEAAPVSIAAYRRYLEDYAAMDAQHRGSLSQNIPPTETDPTPADWERQRAAARQDAPVTHVSYWQALMYARAQRASLPTAAQLAAARAEAGTPGVEEWTASEFPATPPYTGARLVLPAEEDASPLPEPHNNSRSPQRGFRLCY